MTVEKRSRWTTRAMTVPVRPATRYRGAAVHWPGFQFTITDHDSCLRLLRSLEEASLKDGYGALPYQAAACQHGRVIEGRTVARVNGANGSTEANREYGSIVALLTIGGIPSDAMLHAIHEAAAYLNADRILTHNDVRPEPTACPGPRLTKWINDGAPDPEDDMPTPKDMWDHPLTNEVTGNTAKAGTLVTKTHRRVNDIVKLIAAQQAGDQAAIEDALRAVLGSLDD